MTDLGTLTSRGIDTNTFRRPTSFWRSGYALPINLLQYDVSGTISGDVVEDGAPKKRWIRLHQRSTGLYIAATQSDFTTGTFSFAGLDKSDLYYAVKLDDITVAPDFNAEIYDRLTPV